MSTPGDAAKELEQLLMALVDGQLSPEQQQHLMALLRSDPALQQKYRDYLLLDALLQWEHPAKASAPAVRPWRYWQTTLGVVAALAAAIVFAVTFWPPPHPAVGPGEQAAKQNGEPTDDTVAVLLRAQGAVWELADPPPRVGAPLRPSRMVLRSGLAHIQFYSGATVVLEGPADFHVISRLEAYCAKGKLWATVPPTAHGFTIGSPKVDLVDRGTEFGLSVGGDDQTEVHVFQGKVELYDPASKQKTPAHDDLTTGHGLRLDRAGKGSAIASDPASFRTAQNLEARSEKALRQHHQDWLAASEALRRDPSLLVYYSFQEPQRGNMMLTDRRVRPDQARDGAIVGCGWAQGRWPAKQGLEFRQVCDRVRFHVPGEFDSLTLATWVRVDSLPNLNNSLMMTDGWEPGEPHWQIGQDGKLVLGVQEDPKKRGAHYHALNIVTPERFGQWMHLAVVYDREAFQVTHYVDGRPAAQLPIEIDGPLRIGDAEIGNWNVGQHRNKTVIRFLNGCIDEFLMFSRALSDAEVEHLHAQGRPPQ